MLFWSTSSPLLGDGRILFRSVLHSLRWAYALRQASCLEIWQQTSLPRRWISASEKQDCRGSYTMSSSISPARPHKKLLSSAEWNLFSRIILRWDRCLCLSDVLRRPADLPVLPKLQDYWHEQKHSCEVRKRPWGKAIHHHRANQNPYERWSLPQRKPALHHPSDRGCDPLFSWTSGTAAVDAIRTHSAEFSFCLRFEPDLRRVCDFLSQAG